MIITKKKISEMDLATYNPRVILMPEDFEYQALKKSIESHGMVQPVIWNRRTNTVVGGHQRIKVLRDMGIDEVEVSEVDLDPIKEKQLNIILNKVQGKWDYDKLSEIFEELGYESVDTGFTPEEIEAFNRMERSFDDEPEEKDDGEYVLTLTFDKSYKNAINRHINERGIDGIVEAIMQRIRGADLS